VTRRAVLVDVYPQSYGGAQRTIHLIAREAAAHGWETVVATTATGLLTERLAADGLAFEVLAPPASLSRYGHVTRGGKAVRAATALPAYWARVRKFLARTRPAVVHVNDPRGAALFGIPASSGRWPWIWHVHLTEAGRFPTRTLTRRTAGVVVPSRLALDVMPGLVRARRLEVLPSPLIGLDERTDPVELVAAANVTTIARLHPDKGLDVLIDALPELRRAHPSISATVIGGSHPGLEHVRTDLEDRARRLGVDNQLRFTGFLDRPEPILAATRVYVHPSRHEIRPVAITEAMALGLPIVATDVGGVRDLVEHEVSGLLVPPDDPDALAASVLRLLDDHALADRLRAAAFARAHSGEYSAERFVRRVTDLWNAVARDV
jgi:glycosyltransferase involved in cell wall biosynthesis